MVKSASDPSNENHDWWAAQSSEDKYADSLGGIEEPGIRKEADHDGGRKGDKDAGDEGMEIQTKSGLAHG